MFHIHSPYSPFFTSGLLSAASRPHSPDVPISPRRGSLPTDPAQADAFYFTLQPRRDEDEFRSFLSLDLAESQSMRSASLKRKASTSTRTKSFRFPRIPEAPASAPAAMLAAPAPKPLRMRFSRDSLRTIPSPKPAPSITLPELPTKIASTPPRLPSIQLTPSIDIFTIPPPPTASPPRAVPRLRVNTTQHHRISVASSSTVSTRARVFNRSEALARLEGRTRPATAPAAKRNFMSMSDDEHDSSDSDCDAANADDDLSDLDSLDIPALAFLDPVLEPEDVVLPLPAPLPAIPPRADSLRPPSFLKIRTAPLQRQRTRTRRPTLSAGSAGPAADWFPLKSFIDLHGEEHTRDEGLRRVYAAKPARAGSGRSKTRSAESRASAAWNWRSFIEVAHVA